MSYNKTLFPLFNSLLDETERQFVIDSCKNIYKCINTDASCVPDMVDFFIKNKNHLYLLRPSLIGLLINCPDFKLMSSVCVFISELIRLSDSRKADVNDLLSSEITIILTDTIFENTLGKSIEKDSLSSVDDYLSAMKSEIKTESNIVANTSLNNQDDDFEN